MTRHVIIGAGGHACVLMDALERLRAQIEGFVTNDEDETKYALGGVRRIGTDHDLLARTREDIALVNGVGSTGDTDPRRAVFERFRAAGFSFATVVHPTAIVAADATIGEGAQIMAGAIVQSRARIGMNAIVNSGAIVDHGSIVGEHAHVASGACLSGDVTVGAGAHIGAGATIIQGTRVGEGALVAAGAVVVGDVAPAATVMGVPARSRNRY